MTQTRVSSWIVAALAALAACEHSTDVPAPAPPDILVILSGNHQRAIIGHGLNQPLVVQVKAPTGEPRPGVVVVWSVKTGGGLISSEFDRTDSDGRATGSWILGRTPGDQQVTATIPASSIPPVDFDATGTLGALVVRFDGAAWSTQLADTAGALLSLASVWGASASGVFAGGCAGITRFDGQTWSALPACSGLPDVVISLSGRSPSDVFAVVRGALPPSGHVNVRHFNGQQWDNVYSRACSFCALFNAIWADPISDAFLVGESGMVLRYDGATWTPQSSGTSATLRAVWGVSKSQVFAVGGNGTVVHYDGLAWAPQASGTTRELKSISGTSGTDVFAVGTGGTILHYDGSGWSTQSSGTSQDLNAVWALSASDVFAVGNGSTILHYDGSQWTPQTVTTTIDFSGVWGISSTNVFAVGAPR